jgi:class 3 adenylate cyclase
VANPVEHPLAVVVHEPGRVPLRLLVDGAPVEVGRECDGLLLADPTISRRHLSLRVVDGALRVTDLGSPRGTRVGLVPIVGSYALRPDEIVRFGRSTVELWSGPTDPGGPVRDATTPIDRLEASVTSDPPDIARLDTPRSVTTVVLDIHGSHDKSAQMGSERWSSVLEAHASMVRRHSIRAGGLELRCCGDAFVLAFRGALAAVTCAVDVQRAARALARSRPAGAVQVRAGVHTSDAVVRADPHLLGHHLAVTVALTKAARGGEVLVTGIVRELLELHGSATFEPPRRIFPPSSGEARFAHPVRWTPLSTTT